MAQVLALVDAPIEPEWVRSAVEGQSHVLAAAGAALAAVAGQAYAVCGHRMAAEQIVLNEPWGTRCGRCLAVSEPGMTRREGFR